MRTAISMILFCLPVPVFAQWYEARSENFIVLSDGSRSQAEGFARRLERFDQILRINTGNEKSEHGLPIRVVLRRNAREVQQLLWSDSRNVVGFYSANLRGPIAVVDRSAAQSEYDLSGEIVLYHEYSHHFMVQHSPFAYPMWYSEGFAEYHSTAFFRPNGDVDIGRPAMSRAPSLALSKWLPLKQLLTATRMSVQPRDVAMVYAQGWLLTHMLSSDDARIDQLNAYLRATGGGTSVEDAWRAAFGKSVDESDKDLRDYYERLKVKGFSIRRYYSPKFAESAVAVRELSAPEVAAAELDARLRDDMGGESRDKVWSEVEALLRQHPRSVHVLTLAAEAALATRRFVEAQQLADRAIALDDSAQRAMVVRGASVIEAILADSAIAGADAAEARRWIVRANRMNPEDPMALLYNYLSYLARDLEPNDAALDGLRVAHAVLPQSPRVVLALGSLLLRRAQVQEARQVLAPLAFAPHESGWSDEARRMLESTGKAGDASP